MTGGTHLRMLGAAVVVRAAVGARTSSVNQNSSSSPGATSTVSTTNAHAAPTPAAATPTSEPVPTLGRVAGDFPGAGFGQVEPTEIFNDGDPTREVFHIVWGSWGSAQATGRGVGLYVGPGQDVVQGTAEPVTVVAFDLGPCDGVSMYRGVEWSFPRHGGTFDPNDDEDICHGSYVGTP